MDLRKDVLYYDALVDFPAIGQENKLYLNKADGSLYYWDGAAYQLAGDGSGGVTSVTASAPLASSGGATPNISLTVPGNTTTFLRGDGTFATPPAGGLTNFTEAENTSTPNGTVYVDSLTAAASSTNADFAIRPKGTGAIVAAIPDNTATGGNKRGANATDLQTARTAATQVASGAYSFAGGRWNTVSGDSSAALGVQNTVSGGLGAFATGYLSTASGNYSTAHGQCTASGSASIATGNASTASGANSVAMGAGCTASGNNSFAAGTSAIANSTNSVALGYYSTTNGVNGRMAFAQTNSGVYGDTQKSLFILGIRTTNDTATTLVTGYLGGAASTNNQVILSNNSSYRFKGTIIGKQSGSTNVAAWDVDGLIVRGANAAATTLIVSNVNVVDNTPTFGTPTLAADTTNGGLRVQVTGVAATNIQWTATIETTEVIYA